VPPLELTIEQQRALQIVAAAPYGCAEPVLRAQGFSPTVMAALVDAGYVIAKPRGMRAGGRTSRVTRFVITDVGRRAIG
jgi:hypothetical protein